MQSSVRIKIVAIFFYLAIFALIGRLFYWQIIKGDMLASLANSQRESVELKIPHRGSILSSDGFPLAISKEGFLLSANPQKVVGSVDSIAQLLAPILTPDFEDIKIATDASQLEIEKIQDDLLNKTKMRLISQLSNKKLVWALLGRKISKQKKQKIEKLKIEGLNFENDPIRSYPEASMSSHLLGFVAENDQGNQIGYSGLEGFYNLELLGRMGITRQEKDAVNRPIPIGRFWEQNKRDGSNLYLYLDRTVQYIVDQELKKAVEDYGAKSGTVIIMNPKTGGILAMSSYPNFDPNHFGKYDPKILPNPAVSLAYEPGSTFKVLTMAAGIDQKVISPDTKCDICDGPYKVDKYFIRTWNNKYHPNSTMTEVLVHSDNTGMVFVAQRLGLDKFLSYIKAFGIGSKTGIDLEGEIAPALRKKWKDIDLDTASFGQGILVTPIQMVKAVSVIANQGKMMTPHVVSEISGGLRDIKIKPQMESQVISPETAEIVKNMMVASVDDGEAKWTRLVNYRVAGKTGTAQIAYNGEYQADKTIASFVGFAPADDPRFVMLTIINQPTSSPWGSETAAPLFFKIAQKLYAHWGLGHQGM